ncbi:upstream activation factor subunit spp27-like isoform X4 [Camellia sinensis]|uniref:upstream activation factor subunit spp27-like isoform X4 n=1 Tax=Camellia sinensis TaxID=4442 RepID=UPI0010360CA9|nr:upstream activation factor subunit spp27-like isoform X4 [Camellia sinensis]
MVSDSELVNRLWDVLQTSDLNTTTAGSVRRTLESEFGVDLSDRKAFIRDQIDSFLETRVQRTHNNAVAVEEEEEEEEAIHEEASETLKLEDNKSESEEEVESDGQRSKKRSRSDKVDNVVKKRGGGFNKPCGLSPQLQKLVGVPELARPEVVKKIWAHIREKDLQDPKNRRKILCDEALRAIFRVNSIDMFQMNKVLSKHIWPIDEEDGPNEPDRKVKQQKGKKGSGFLAPLPLSDALVNFFGTGESELSRADVVKRMWEYIKKNDLQDPSDKRRILCDEKLKELFEVDSFHGFTVSKLLAAHFIKAEQ